MDYILIEFTLGLEGPAYQEVLDGEVIRYCDLNGVTIDLPAITESRVVNATPERPEWAA